MERAAWTDERLDDLAESMRTGFVRSETDHRETRTEMREAFAEVRTDFAQVRTEMREGFAQVRAEIESLRQTMFRIGGGMMIGFISLLGAIIARGA